MAFTKPIIIGLEIHTELNTKTKLFCGCATQGNDEPNTRTCEVCLGHPGSKPVVNKKAIDFALKLASALNCSISDEIIFSRKQYFYPDMAKNYQITQYEIPLGKNGNLKLNDRSIGITRVHLEEDPASLVHTKGIASSKYVLVDYNRSGNPLAEIVTEPEIHSAKQAREFMKKLITILEYLKIFVPGQNIIKADANISIRESGYVRTEIKNITGFREIKKALEYEIERQKHILDQGKKLSQETRSWNAEKQITELLRKKETEKDYGYIIDPDLVQIEISKKQKKEIKKQLPELPDEKFDKYVKKYKIAEDDAKVISSELSLAQLFETAAEKIDPKLASRWIRRELIRVLNYNDISIDEFMFNQKEFLNILDLLEKNKITEKTAKRLLEKLVEKDFDVKEYVEKNNLLVISDSNLIKDYCKKAIEENPDVVEDYKSENKRSINFLVGQVMKMSKGKADAKEVKEILEKLI
ncbi:Asp-tRNA(Asn)/Glu-tRNA(Gln) amidotransferase subunit GatB [Candidatus Woesearchaeota archaeon]|nr:Asp-tRNA(Asn)/Glu-tRNA(Gln) amidotransferase subunit GatB [Candidatus Woesearchaeota archaeon]